MLDDAIAAPAVWYRDGTIGCAAEDCERLIAACDSLRQFLAWRDAPVIAPMIAWAEAPASGLESRS